MEPCTLPLVAVMVAVPCASVATTPAAFTRATALSLDDQVTDDVRFCVDESLKVPVAVNCCEMSQARVGAAGVTAMETSVAPATIRVVWPATLPH